MESREISTWNWVEYYCSKNLLSLKPKHSYRYCMSTFYKQLSTSLLSFVMNWKLCFSSYPGYDYHMSLETAWDLDPGLQSIVFFYLISLSFWYCWLILCEIISSLGFQSSIWSFADPCVILVSIGKYITVPRLSRYTDWWKFGSAIIILFRFDSCHFCDHSFA